MSQPTSRTAEIRKIAKAGDGKAEQLLAELLRDLFRIEARNVAINHDQYSLNSLNGFFETEDGAFFFKFHQEEGEEAMSGEYYRADILARAGLPVDQPLLMSVLPGEQILVYRRRTDPRFSDVLRALDLKDDAAARGRAVEAERRLSEAVLKVYLATLHTVGAREVAAEPIHRLFYERLVDPSAASYPGGRMASFYVGKDFAFPNLTLDWETLSRCRFVVNGIEYSDSIGALFDAAHERLNPARLADAGGSGRAWRRPQCECLVRGARWRGTLVLLRSRLCRRKHSCIAGRGEDDLSQHLCPSALALRSRHGGRAL